MLAPFKHREIERWRSDEAAFPGGLSCGMPLVPVPSYVIYDRISFTLEAPACAPLFRAEIPSKDKGLDLRD